MSTTMRDMRNPLSLSLYLCLSLSHTHTHTHSLHVDDHARHHEVARRGVAVSLALVERRLHHVFERLVGQEEVLEERAELLRVLGPRRVVVHVVQEPESGEAALVEGDGRAVEGVGVLLLRLVLDPLRELLVPGSSNHLFQLP